MRNNEFTLSGAGDADTMTVIPARKNVMNRKVIPVTVECITDREVPVATLKLHAFYATGGPNMPPTGAMSRTTLVLIVPDVVNVKASTRRRCRPDPLSSRYILRMDDSNTNVTLYIA